MSYLKFSYFWVNCQKRLNSYSHKEDQQDNEGSVTLRPSRSRKSYLKYQEHHNENIFLPTGSIFGISLPANRIFYVSSFGCYKIIIVTKFKEGQHWSKTWKGFCLNIRHKKRRRLRNVFRNSLANFKSWRYFPNHKTLL